MTAVEMRDLFFILYDKITNLAAPGYTDDEVSDFLNKAQLQFVKHRYNEKGNKYQEGFEETEKRRKDLAQLTRNLVAGASSDQTGVSPNGVFYDLPEGFMYTLREEATISSDDACIDGKRIYIKPITHDEYAINLLNPFKQPDHTVAWRLDYSNTAPVSGTATKRHELVTDGTYSVGTYHLRYLNMPANIDIAGGITSELDPSVHEEVVDAAVRIAAGITDPGTYQIKVVEEQQGE
jgi:hypothetical protein